MDKNNKTVNLTEQEYKKLSDRRKKLVGFIEQAEKRIEEYCEKQQLSTNKNLYEEKIQRESDLRLMYLDELNKVNAVLKPYDEQQEINKKESLEKESTEYLEQYREKINKIQDGLKLQKMADDIFEEIGRAEDRLEKKPTAFWENELKELKQKEKIVKERLYSLDKEDKNSINNELEEMLNDSAEEIFEENKEHLKY